MAAIVRRRRRRRQNAISMRRPRVFRDLSNPLESLDEEKVYKRYIFSPATILFIVDGISNILQTDTVRNQPLIQVLLFLRFVATGAHLRLVGDSLNESESSVGRVVKSVARATIEVFTHMIKFPVGDMASKVREGFERIAVGACACQSYYDNVPARETAEPTLSAGVISGIVIGVFLTIGFCCCCICGGSSSVGSSSGQS
uniref:Uncharacterized protein n=1 Tax=Magallana gigas TaxID=29159 RepID=A0A8W8LT89_MAGGI